MLLLPVEKHTYGNSIWGDLLTAYNGAGITYDEIGNPDGYNDRTFTWEHGRQMATQTRDGVEWEYTYNNAGLRTKRSNGSTTYDYVYSGDKLVQMTITDHTTSPETVQRVELSYDAAGQPLTMTLDGTMYYYVLNIQGDVMGLVDGSGNLMLSLNYEGYGEGFFTNNTSDMVTTLASTNPLGYRGYVMDAGTGLYYLQSRYYDPNVGRFLNADGLLSTRHGLVGNNMFAYCNNNPVNKADYSGEEGQTIELGNGWYYRIDPENTSTETQRHIHIWNEHNGKEYIQNEDGSPHDKKKGKGGKIPKWLNKKLVEKAGWDYNGNRTSFFEETTFACYENGTQYTFADGTTAFKPFNPYIISGFSVAECESVYFNACTVSINSINTPQAFYVPITGPVTLPSFSFGFGWGLYPIPLFI